MVLASVLFITIHLILNYISQLNLMLLHQNHPLLLSIEYQILKLLNGYISLSATPQLLPIIHCFPHIFIQNLNSYSHQTPQSHKSHLQVPQLLKPSLAHSARVLYSISLPVYQTPPLMSVVSYSSPRTLLSHISYYLSLNTQPAHLSFPASTPL